MKREYAAVLGGLVLAGVSASAQAATTENDLTPQITVPGACAISAATLDFGTPAPSATSIDSSTTVTVSCSITTTFFIGMNNGLNASGAQRQMQGSSGDFLAYNLYRNAALSLPWGTGANQLFGAAAATIPADFTIYGRVPTVNPAALTGSYSDTVVMTLTF